MSQEEIEKEFPELKNAISQAHVKPFGSFGMSETERTNHSYAIDRYFLIDSQNYLASVKLIIRRSSIITFLKKVSIRLR